MVFVEQPLALPGFANKVTSMVFGKKGALHPLLYNILIKADQAEAQTAFNEQHSPSSTTASTSPV